MGQTDDKPMTTKDNDTYTFEGNLKKGDTFKLRCKMVNGGQDSYRIHLTHRRWNIIRMVVMVTETGQLTKMVTTP